MGAGPKRWLHDGKALAAHRLGHAAERAAKRPDIHAPFISLSACLAAGARFAHQWVDQRCYRRRLGAVIPSFRRWQPCLFNYSKYWTCVGYDYLGGWGNRVVNLSRPSGRTNNG